MPDLSQLGGWIDDGGAQVIGAGVPSLSQAAPGLILADKPATPILLYKAWSDVLGKYPDYPAQQIGDCVSFGHGHANDVLQCVEIALGEPSEYRETDTEWIYGTSRQVAGILGPFDGSYGSAAVRAMTMVGLLSREQLGADGAYKGSRAKSWGGWSGPPAAHKPLAAQFKLGAVAKIRTTQEGISALWNGCPYTICSNQGFTMTRDQNGFCRASGRWAHCMFVCAWRPSPEGFLICQSWGPNTPGGPLDLDQPNFSFWCEPATMQKILNADDSWGLIGSPDFVKKSLPSDWTRA